MEKEGKTTGVGDEGGFAPDLKDAEEVFSYLTRAIKEAGYEPGRDVVFAMDAAASELYNKDSGMYEFQGEGYYLQQTKSVTAEYSTQARDAEVSKPDTVASMKLRSTDEMIAYYKMLCEKSKLIIKYRLTIGGGFYILTFVKLREERKTRCRLQQQAAAK